MAVAASGVAVTAAAVVVRAGDGVAVGVVGIGEGVAVGAAGAGEGSGVGAIAVGVAVGVTGTGDSVAVGAGSGVGVGDGACVGAGGGDRGPCRCHARRGGRGRRRADGFRGRWLRRYGTGSFRARRRRRDLLGYGARCRWRALDGRLGLNGATRGGHGKQNERRQSRPPPPCSHQYATTGTCVKQEAHSSAGCGDDRPGPQRVGASRRGVVWGSDNRHIPASIDFDRWEKESTQTICVD